MQVCIVLCVSCMAARKITILLLPEARGTVDGITRGKKSKETGVDAGRSREQEKEEINLTLVNFTPLNYRC